jgi:hypothetical protein
MLEEALRIYLEMGQKRGIARVLEGFAYMALHQHDVARGLKLAGAADSLRRSVGARLRAFEQAQLEATLKLARKKRRPESANAAWDAGCRMTLREAIEFAVNRPLSLKS